MRHSTLFQELIEHPILEFGPIVRVEDFGQTESQENTLVKFLSDRLRIRFTNGRAFNLARKEIHEYE